MSLNPFLENVIRSVPEVTQLQIMEAIRWEQQQTVDELAAKLRLKVVTEEFYRDFIRRNSK